MSINWHLDAEPAPAILVLPRDAASLDEAHAAIELWEFYKRRKLDPSQRLVVEVMMATRADGLWAAATTGREMPRQNGKGDEIEVVELWGLTQRAERILHTIHDAVLLATETQSRLLTLLEGHADLRRLKERAWQGTGQQMIEMKNGGIVWYRTRSGGGARGVDEVDRIVIDEAQHAEEEHLAAVTPTQLASVNPQLNAVGTAGIAGKSVWWWRQRRRALTGGSAGFGYVGHTAEDLTIDTSGNVVSRCAPDVRDRTVCRRANPALVAGRVGESFFAEQLEVLGAALYAREHLGVWDPEPDVTPTGAFSAERWTSLAGPTPERGLDVAFALDVAPDHSSASIAASWRLPDGPKWLQLAEHLPGVEWVPNRMEQLLRAWGGRLVVEQTGTAAFLLPRLPGAETVSRRFYADACSTLDADVSSSGLRHGNQPELNAAVAAARWSLSGEAGQRVLSRKDPRASPLVAAALAVHALLSARQAGGWMVGV